MATVLGLSCIGCGGASVGDPPVYTSDEKYEIGMWVGISDSYKIYDENGVFTGETHVLTDEEFLEKYQEIADAGFTIAFPGYEKMNDGGAYNFKALEAASKVGIKHIIADGTLKNELLSARSNVEQGIKSEEQIVNRVKEIIKPYLDSEYSDALCGFMIRDEPSRSLYEDLAFGYKIFKQAAPDLVYYVNLFPVIAGGSQLSGTGEAIKYVDYVDDWIEMIEDDYISYDHYPLYKSGSDYSLEPSFLYNMDVMQTAIKKEGTDRQLWTFLQSIAFGSRNRGLESKADASFQAYSFLAFGGEGIQWFTYTCPPPNDGATNFGNNALLDRNYEKTATYDYVAATNLEIQGLMKYYKNFEWQGVILSSVYDDSENFAYLGNSENVMQSTEQLTAFTSTEDAFTGVFEDKDGNEAYILVNFTDPALNSQNEVTLNISGKSAVLIVRGGQETTQAVSGGKLTLTLEPGEGVFVLPY